MLLHSLVFFVADGSACPFLAPLALFFANLFLDAAGFGVSLKKRMNDGQSIFKFSCGAAASENDAKTVTLRPSFLASSLLLSFLLLFSFIFLLLSFLKRLSFDACVFVRPELKFEPGYFHPCWLHVSDVSHEVFVLLTRQLSDFEAPKQTMVGGFLSSFFLLMAIFSRLPWGTTGGLSFVDDDRLLLATDGVVNHDPIPVFLIHMAVQRIAGVA